MPADIHDYTVTAAGELWSRRIIRPTEVEPAAVALVAGLIAGGACKCEVPHSGGLSLSYTPDQRGVALATIWRGRVPLTTSALLTGRDPGADAEALAALQRMIEPVWRRAGMPDRFPLWSLDARPVILSVPFPVPDPDGIAMAADIETVLAVAYFADR